MGVQVETITPGDGESAAGCVSGLNPSLILRFSSPVFRGDFPEEGPVRRGALRR